MPLGIWTDRFGGRIVLFTVMLLCVMPAIFMMSYATEYWHFLVLGLFVGLAGGSFRWARPMWLAGSPKSQQGFAMGCSVLVTPARPSTSLWRP